jgi:hypothetical protein
VEGKGPDETRQPVQCTMVPIPAVIVCEIREMVKNTSSYILEEVLFFYKKIFEVLKGEI